VHVGIHPFAAEVGVLVPQARPLRTRVQEPFDIPAFAVIALSACCIIG